ncbi:hypothetical protein ACV229_26720 [Burkholderia sp. MR1-5-21]
MLINSDFKIAFLIVIFAVLGAMIGALLTALQLDRGHTELIAAAIGALIGVAVIEAVPLLT